MPPKPVVVGSKPTGPASNVVKARFSVHMVSFDEDPMAVFQYALKSPVSKKKYPQRFKVFLAFLGYNGVFKDDTADFLRKARENPEWIEDKLIKFITYQIGRLDRSEIAAATIANYYKAVKLFCEMNRIVLAWKVIRRGVPTGNKAADDRAPTLEELRKLVEYPDPRIKPIGPDFCNNIGCISISCPTDTFVGGFNCITNNRVLLTSCTEPVNRINTFTCTPHLS